MEHAIPTVHRRARASESSPSYQAYQILHAAFVLIPALAGLDKFFNYMADWDSYLAPTLEKMLPMSTGSLVATVAVLEIVTAVIVAIKPRIGAYMVAAWLVCIIVNLMLARGHYDIVLRDVGLALGAIALGRLAAIYDGGKQT